MVEAGNSGFQDRLVGTQKVILNSKNSASLLTLCKVHKYSGNHVARQDRTGANRHNLARMIPPKASNAPKCDGFSRIAIDDGAQSIEQAIERWRRSGRRKPQLFRAGTGDPVGAMVAEPGLRQSCQLSFVAVVDRRAGSANAPRFAAGNACGYARLLPIVQTKARSRAPDLNAANHVQVGAFSSAACLGLDPGVVHQSSREENASNKKLMRQRLRWSRRAVARLRCWPPAQGGRPGVALPG